MARRNGASHGKSAEIIVAASVPGMIHRYNSPRFGIHNNLQPIMPRIPSAKIVRHDHSDSVPFGPLFG